MNPRYRTNSQQSLPTVSGSVPRPHAKMGGRPVSHSTSASSVALSYRANYQPYGSRSDRHATTSCQADGVCVRILIVIAYFVTVTFGAGFLTFWYSSLWIPHVSQMFKNESYGNITRSHLDPSVNETALWTILCILFFVLGFFAIRFIFCITNSSRIDLSRGRLFLFFFFFFYLSWSRFHFLWLSSHCVKCIHPCVPRRVRRSTSDLTMFVPLEIILETLTFPD